MIRVLDISGCELRREVCQTLVEGMIVSLVALAAAVVLGIVGQDVTSLSSTVSTKSRTSIRRRRRAAHGSKGWIAEGEQASPQSTSGNPGKEFCIREGERRV